MNGEEAMPKAVLLRAEPNTEVEAAVLIIDDDEDLRNLVGRLQRSVGLNAQLFASIPVINSECQNPPGCLVLDVRLSGKKWP